MGKKGKKIIFLAMAIWLYGYMAIGLSSSVFAQERPRAEISSDRVIVRFKKDKPLGIKISQMLAQGASLEETHLQENTFTFKVAEGKALEQAKALNADPEVEFAIPDFKSYALETPNDPHFSKQWALPKIAAPAAWDLSHGSSTVQVAIVDTGVDGNHEDLKEKVDQRVKFCEGSNCQTVDDRVGHGTHVAGIVGAVTNNNKGVAGVGWETHLLSVKVLDDNGSAERLRWITNGINWVLNNTNAKVINMSLGGWGYYSPEEGIDPCNGYKDVLEQAKNKGVLVVVAAGNSRSGSIDDDICVNRRGQRFRCRFVPAACEGVLAVAATGPNDEKAGYSNYGPKVDIAAPGGNATQDRNGDGHLGSGDCISEECPLSTVPGNQYELMEGTSMAAPFVSGLAGLLFGANSSLTASQVRSLIEQNADKISGTGTYWTHGRINAYQSVLAATGGATPTPTPTGEVTGTPTPSPTPSPTPGGPTSTPTPTLTVTPTPIPFNCVLNGDFDNNGTVDEADLTLWQTAFSAGNPNASLACFEYWRRNRY